MERFESIQRALIAFLKRLCWVSILIIYAFHDPLISIDDGIEMAKGEFESMQALHSISPRFVLCPVGYGTDRSDRRPPSVL